MLVYKKIILTHVYDGTLTCTYPEYDNGWKLVDTDAAKLEIKPKPDSILRVFMPYKKIEKPIKIEKPEFVPFERK